MRYEAGRHFIPMPFASPAGPNGTPNTAGVTTPACKTCESFWVNVFNASTQPIVIDRTTELGRATTTSRQPPCGYLLPYPCLGCAAKSSGLQDLRVELHWLTSYSPSGGFGSWSYLAGVFSTDPVMASCPDGSVYRVGKDNWGSLWSGRYIPGPGFQRWQWGQGIVKGKPSVTCGTDSVAYVTARDNWDALWMARVQGNSWLGWSYGGGVMSGDPQVAASGDGLIYTVLREPWGGVWYRGYTQGTSGGWLAWVM